jgi:hypothetical protein
MFLDCGVQVFDIRAVVHVVMQLHGLSVNCGIESRIVIRQSGQFVRHGSSSEFER